MHNILIIGVGMIGGSLGMALRGSGHPVHVCGYDTDRQTVKQALAIGAIDSGVELREGVAAANIVIICTPLSSFEQLLISIKPYLQDGTIVTDTGSTKQAVMDLYARILPDRVWGIGGHPMAGSEIQGINGADGYLFENAVYALTPPQNVPSDLMQKLTNLLTATGAHIHIMTPERHDELVAVVSHIPHIAAANLVNLTGGDSEQLMMAAGGFRDVTRIASSDSGIWKDILLSNQEQLVAKLNRLIGSLQEFKEALENKDAAYIINKLEAARTIRSQISDTRKGLLPGVCDIVCLVPDKPGIIGQMGQFLGKNNINIIDIEILRVREGDGGTMRLGLSSPQDAHRAVELLPLINIKAWVR